MQTRVPDAHIARRAGDVAVLVPIKAFGLAKHRLAGALAPEARERLARDLADRVVRAAAPLPVFVVCEDDEVAGWARARDATPVRGAGGGLTAAVEHGVAAIAAAGFSYACVVHADLPRVVSLDAVARHPGVAFAPDRHRDGTNVACVPVHAGFRFAYGPGSFARHVAEAQRLGLEVRVVDDATLAWDVDTGDDLAGVGAGGQYPRTVPFAAEGSMIQLDLPVPRSALAIAAHPDDVEFQCGATFAKWAAQGCVLHHLICTDGSKGTWDPQADTAALVATRVVEQRAAADALGSRGEVRFLGAVDGELEHTRANVSTIARIIRELRPEVVFAHDPWRRWRLHPDHRAAGFLACDAVVAARDPHFFPEHGIAHHRPSAMFLFETEEPNHAEDVTGHEAAKVQALLAHVSQFETTMDITDPADEAQRARFATRVHDELATTGRRVGVPAAEAFRRLLDL